jgi:hypothetical protein
MDVDMATVKSTTQEIVDEIHMLPREPELTTISAPSIVSFMGAAANAAPSATSMPHATSTQLENIPTHTSQH